jgi:hypothetical protein
MSLQLLKHLLFVELVYPGEGLRAVLRAFPSFALPHTDMRSIDKPEGPVLVPRKFCFHLENLMIVDLLYKVAHFEALLKAVSVLVSSPKELSIISEPFVVVVYLGVQIVKVQGCLELDHMRGSTA